MTLTSTYKHFSDVNPLHWHWKNFHPSEISCKCCGALIANYGALDSLQKFRYFAGVPVILNSAYRCEKHNKAVGGSPNSQHRLGTAFDVRITSRLSRNMIHEFAKEAGFRAFGDYNTFVHIDTRDTPAYWDERK